MIFIKHFKKNPMDYSTFIQEYQQLTASFIQNLQKSQQMKEDLMIEKLICMHSCTKMKEYDQILMRKDIEELLRIYDIRMMNTQINDGFHPDYHKLRQSLYDDYSNYYVKEIIEEGYILGNKVIKKALVEVERRTK
ncbi:MAG: nucleotide exchange factor GrpE [Traorella sp.]